MTALLTIVAAIAVVGVLGVSVPSLILKSARVSNWSPRRQLKAVRTARFQRQRVLNRSELPRFKVIEEEIAAARRGYRTFAQVNLGEILETKSRGAFHLINSKRIDMLITDRDGWPVLAVEYQGEGHYQGNAMHRDAIKKTALTKAGVKYLEVFPDDSSEQIRSHVRGQLGWAAPSPMNFKGSPVPRPVPAGTFGRARGT